MWSCDLNSVLPSGESKKCNLQNVLYVPRLSYNLFSVSVTTECGKTVRFSKDSCYGNKSYSCRYFWRSNILEGSKNPVKTLLQDLSRKVLFSCSSARSRSCEILWDLVGFCRNLAGIMQQDSCKSHKILQDLAEMQEKGPFLENLARAFSLGFYFLPGCLILEGSGSCK